MPEPVIDTHQHLIYPDRFRYPWLDDVPALSGKAFLLQDYRRTTQESGILGTLVMEADVAAEQALEEARFFSALAAEPDSGILGVIAACRPESAGFVEHLDLLPHPAVKGVRRILHNQRDGLSKSALFRRNVASLRERDLTFDMCVLSRQLPLAIELADACPGTRLMLDHCGGPDIAGGGFKRWAADISELALRPHVFCKLSGLVTCATRETVGTDLLRPWIAHAVECFGFKRLVWGGDWPVCQLTSTLSDWIRIFREVSGAWTVSEKRQVFFANAISFYGLSQRGR